MNIARNIALYRARFGVCYSCAMNDQYSDLSAKLIRNSRILCDVLPFESLPEFNPPETGANGTKKGRFEAFADLSSVNQCINYFNTCVKNPGVNFAIWTKNPFIIDQCIKAGHKKPDNLKILVSSLMKNETRDVSAYSFVDHVFTVYTLDYLLDTMPADKIKSFINCGARSCANCGKCYDRGNDAPFYINEMEKADAKKAVKTGILPAHYMPAE